jgi:hypothetical protein
VQLDQVLGVLCCGELAPRSRTKLLDTRVRLSKWDVDAPANQSTVLEHPLHVRAGCFSARKSATHCHVLYVKSDASDVFCTPMASDGRASVTAA